MDDVVQGNRTPLQELLANKHVSALQKYQEMAVGERGIVALLRYEFFMCCLAGTPGAAGLWLRSRLYGYFLGRVGQGVIIGRNVTIRHPKRISLGNNVVIDDGCVLDAKGQGETGIVVGNKSSSAVTLS
jgi:acetyltransferase-like isoleucine patch superfamily enzyme